MCCSNWELEDIMTFISETLLSVFICYDTKWRTRHVGTRATRPNVRDSERYNRPLIVAYVIFRQLSGNISSDLQWPL